MVSKVRPNGHIWMHAEQFHEAAEMLWNSSGDMNRLALPLVVNYALSAELAMKAAEGVTNYGAVIDGIIGAATQGSTAHGHDLAKVFAKLQLDARTAIEQEFQTATGESLQPLLTKCANYFVQARYAYEASGGGYDLGAIRSLSGGLLKAVMAYGLKRPH